MHSNVRVGTAYGQSDAGLLLDFIIHARGIQCTKARSIHAVRTLAHRTADELHARNVIYIPHHFLRGTNGDDNGSSHMDASQFPTHHWFSTAQVECIPLRSAQKKLATLSRQFIYESRDISHKTCSEHEHSLVFRLLMFAVLIHSASKLRVKLAIALCFNQ